jgi:peroxiredoxin Q/BCP
MSLIDPGRKAPSFRLKDQDEALHSLADYAGRPVVLYFYPKDDTPGCTKEACGFRDFWKEIQKTGAVVVGVSPDSGASHQKFRAKYKLPFALLSDPDKKMMSAYGAFGEKMMYGKKVTGIIRSTVWIGPDGKVVKHWARVPKAEAHPEKVLEALKGKA